MGFLTVVQFYLQGMCHFLINEGQKIDCTYEDQGQLVPETSVAIPETARVQMTLVLTLNPAELAGFT